MLVRRFRILLLPLAAVLAVALVAPSTANASSRHLRLSVRGGETSVTTATGLVTSLLGAKIVAFATAPGSASLITPADGPHLVARFPVSGGAVALPPLRGAVGHRGGLLLSDLDTAKSVAVDNFVVDITHRILTAHVVGTAIRLTVFSLDLSHAVLRLSRNAVTVARVGLVLTVTAAGALNAALGTTVFKAGTVFGSASSRLVVRS